MKVSVSILKEYDRLINAVNKVNQSKADFLHIDVMDGKFVDNQKFPLEVVKDIKKIKRLLVKFKSLFINGRNDKICTTNKAKE